MQFVKNITLNILIACAYVIAGLCGGLLASQPSFASPFWPAADIALATLLIFGNRVLVGIFIGAAITHIYNHFNVLQANALTQILTDTSLKAFSTCLQAWVGVYLINRFVGKNNPLLDLPRILLFFLYGAIVACAISPTIGISWLFAKGIITADNYFFAWANWWVGDTIGVVIFTPIIMSFLGQPQTIWKPRRLTVAFPLLFLLVLIFYIFSYTKQQELTRNSALFAHRVERVENIIQDNLNSYQHITEYLAEIISVGTHLSADEFQAMTHSALHHHSDIIAIAFINSASDAQLQPASSINKKSFPIQLIEPLTPNQASIGFDITHTGNDRDILYKAIRSGEALSSSLSYLNEHEPARTATSIIYAPVYKKNALLETSVDRENNLLGVIAVIFNIENNNRKLLAALVANQILIKIKNHDALIFSNFPETIPAISAYKQLKLTTNLYAAGNTWQITYLPSGKFLSSQNIWHIWWILFGGLIATCLVSLGLMILTGRTTHIADQVRIKTKDLNFINKQLSQEMALRHQLETEQRVRNMILELLAKGEDFKKILTQIVKNTERLDQQTICSILLLDEKGTHLNYGASVSLPDFYIQATDHLRIGKGVGSCGSSAYSVKRVIVEDIMHHPYWAKYKQLAEKAGLLACWSEPILSSKGKILGTFALYYRQTKKPSLANLEFLVRMTNLTAIAIERKQTEAELRIAATTFQSHDAVVITDAEGTILRVNKAYTDISGYTAQEVLGKNPRILNSGRHDKAFFSNMYQELAKYGRWQGEIWNRHKDGSCVPERFTITAVYDGSLITHYVAIFSDISDKKANEEEIQKLAFYDPLTSLPNRRLLLNRLDQAIISAKRHQRFGALIYMDLDHFKNINDSLGHQVGDDLLIQTANRIKHAIRKEDTACRLGGDEFVVLVNEFETSLNEAIEQAANIAEKIREQINQVYFFGDNAQKFSTSIGVTVFPDLVSKPEEILEQADSAMYRSKQTGRNTVSFFSQQMQSEHNRRIKLETQLRDAIAKQQLSLHYQGQVDNQNNLVSAEALLRWYHPELGLMPLHEFIPIAEESHLIVEIGEWVLNAACMQIKHWLTNNFKLEYIAINISPRQFRQIDFIKQIKNAVSISGIEPRYLMLELTEGIVIDDIKDTIDKMLQIQKMGIAISIDDFGTGYSSLAYLKQLPLKQLKIDRSFVNDITKDVSDEIIVEAIITLAHKLNLDVIAEGVETEGQLQFLKDKGCDKYQGYYFSQPLNATDFFKRIQPALSTSS